MGGSGRERERGRGVSGFGLTDPTHCGQLIVLPRGSYQRSLLTSCLLICQTSIEAKNNMELRLVTKRRRRRRIVQRRYNDLMASPLYVIWQVPMSLILASSELDKGLGHTG